MKQLLKRMAAVALSLTVILLFTPAFGGQVFATEDTTPPVLDVDSIHVEVLGTDGTVARPGDTVRIYADIYDEETPPLSRIYLNYWSPMTDSEIYLNDGTNVDGTNTWYWDLDITESTESGVWRWYALRAEDSVEPEPNFVWYMNKNVYDDPAPREYDRYLDLSAGDFTVEGTDPDVDPPVIDLTTLKAAPSQALSGETVTVSVRITDNVAVKEAKVWIMRPDGNTDAYNTVPMTYNSSTKRWEFQLPVTEETMRGDWSVWYLNAYDTNGLDTTAGDSDTLAPLATFTVTDVKSITPAVALSASSYTYDGKVKKPTVTVKDGSKKLTAGTDYTVTYASGRKNVGKYSVKVTLKGSYSGSKTVYFKINPKGTTLKTPAAASKAATIKWTKQSAKMSTSRISGYQIMLATNSKFTTGKKTVNVTGYSKVSKKVTGLKGGKKYYVKIRTYKTVSGTKYYSPWTKVKTVTTKK